MAIVGIIELEIHPERPGVPGDSADEGGVIVRQHGPAVDILPGGILVPDVRHFPDGLLIVLPAVHRRGNLLPPQIVRVHDVPGERIDILPLQPGFLVQLPVLVRHLLPAAGQQRQQRHDRYSYPSFHNRKDSHLTAKKNRALLEGPVRIIDTPTGTRPDNGLRGTEPHSWSCPPST